MKNVKLFAVLLAAIAVLPVLEGCGETEIHQPSENSAALSEETAAADTEEQILYSDNLPRNLNFGGDNVRIFYRESMQDYNVFGTNNAGDIVTDAIWERNLRVEERLNVSFEYISSGKSDVGSVTQSIREQGLAGLNDWDIIITTNNTTVTQNMDNLMLDLDVLSYIDLSQPYWWKDAMDNVTLTGDSYRYLIGEAMLLNYLRTGAFFYNKRLYKDLYDDAEEPYALVLDGKWTVDTMMERARGAYQDLNANGKTDKDDIVGYVFGNTYEEQMCQMAEAFDIQTYVRNDDGSVTIDMGNEHIYDVSEKLYEIAHQSCSLSVNSAITEAGSVFANGTSLFMPGRFDQAIRPEFRDMEDDYGILPYPKYDESQKNYVSLCHNSSCNICALQSLPEEKYEIVGAVLEAFGSESHQSVTPVFVESALKFKYSRDVSSGQVIDIIFNSIHKDLIHEYTSTTKEIYNILITFAPKKEGAYISAYEKKLSAAQESLDKAIEAIRNGQ